MPYHPIGIEQLSHPQIQKLLSGGRIKVKHGSAHKFHLSSEQHKKLARAHAKGAGITLELDPYQIDAHEHLRGEGFMKHLKSGLKKATHFAPVQALAHKAIERASEYAAHHGIDPRMIEQASSMAHSQFMPPVEGGSFKSFSRGVQKFAKNPIVNKLGRMAINEATGGLAGMGLGSMAHHSLHPVEGGSFKSFSRGVQKFAKNPIVNKLGRMAINEATGGLAGMGIKHKGPVKRGHKKKGAALFPAGSGFDGMGFGF